MAFTRNDLTRLIKFSLDKYKFEFAVKAFPMFTPDQIKYVYSMSASARKKLSNRKVPPRRTVILPVLPPGE